jgi:protein-S-isoprenylcysteine O-methyltransferase Ste14
MILVRALVYGSAFVGFVLVFLPARVAEWAGASAPEAWGPPQWAGATLVLLGIVPMAWSFITFVFRGRGTPAPFDPPRRLVVDGPYRFVRNPMYWGAILSLSGAALYYRSVGLAGYVGAFAAWAHLFVVYFEEPRLRRTFGDAYAGYCRNVGRWIPGPPSPP